MRGGISGTLYAGFEVEDAQKRMGGKWTKMGPRDQFSLRRIEPGADLCAICAVLFKAAPFYELDF